MILQRLGIYKADTDDGGRYEKAGHNIAGTLGNRALTSYVNTGWGEGERPQMGYGQRDEQEIPTAKIQTV